MNKGNIITRLSLILILSIVFYVLLPNQKPTAPILQTESSVQEEEKQKNVLETISEENMDEVAMPLTNFLEKAESNSEEDISLRQVQTHDKDGKKEHIHPAWNYTVERDDDDNSHHHKSDSKLENSNQGNYTVNYQNTTVLDENTVMVTNITETHMKSNNTEGLDNANIDFGNLTSVTIESNVEHNITTMNLTEDNIQITQVQETTNTEVILSNNSNIITVDQQRNETVIKFNNDNNVDENSDAAVITNNTYQHNETNAQNENQISNNSNVDETVNQNGEVSIVSANRSTESVDDNSTTNVESSSVNMTTSQSTETTADNNTVVSSNTTSTVITETHPEIVDNKSNEQNSKSENNSDSIAKHDQNKSHSKNKNHNKAHKKGHKNHKHNKHGKKSHNKNNHHGKDSRLIETESSAINSLLVVDEAYSQQEMTSELLSVEQRDENTDEEGICEECAAEEEPVMTTAMLKELNGQNFQLVMFGLFFLISVAIAIVSVELYKSYPIYMKEQKLERNNYLEYALLNDGEEYAQEVGIRDI